MGRVATIRTVGAVGRQKAPDPTGMGAQFFLTHPINAFSEDHVTGPESACDPLAPNPLTAWESPAWACLLEKAGWERR